MKATITTAVLGLFLVMAVGFPAGVRADTDEARLETVQKDIDKQTPVNESERVQALAKQFNVDPAVVQDLRAKNQGWGEVSIELAMAQHLAQTDPKTYPTLTDALKKIETMRADKMGWGKIAKDLGFKLGPVVSAAMHTRNELRKEARTGQSPKLMHDEGSGAKTDKSGRPDFAGRPDRSQRPERLERFR